MNKYIEQLPDCPKVRLSLAEDLNSKLELCIRNIISFDTDKQKIGISQFDKIILDGYAKHTYPATTVLYYQIKIIVKSLKFCGNLESERLSSNDVSIKVSKLLKTTYKYMNMIKLINRKLPDKFEKYNKYFEEFTAVLVRMEGAFRGKGTSSSSSFGNIEEFIEKKSDRPVCVKTFGAEMFLKPFTKYADSYFNSNKEYYDWESIKKEVESIKKQALRFAKF